MIVLADSSPLITLARARCLTLLRELYGQVIVSPEVYSEVTAVISLPGAKEVRTASWIRVESASTEPDLETRATCTGLARELKADLVLIDEVRARRAARAAQLSIAGSIAVLGQGARLGRVGDLRSVYQSLLDQGIRYDKRMLNVSLERLGIPRLSF